MGEMRRIWLINNESSGSNDAEALERCEQAFADKGFAIAQRTVFPAQELPTPAVLRAAEIDLLAVFAGDGTINATLEALAGWGGEVLVLPGGTMNLLYHRLFGQLELEEALAAVADGTAQARRPKIIEAPCGSAYAGMLAGPGTAWNNVREAMRANAPLEIIAEAREAMAETIDGDWLGCESPRLGREQGYPLILLTPEDGNILIDAYHAEDTAEFLEQFMALVRREFRDGPHDRLGEVEEVVLANAKGSGFCVLLDGEPCDVEKPTRFALVEAPVNLLATRSNG